MRDESSSPAASVVVKYRRLADDAGLAPPSGHMVNLGCMYRPVAAAKAKMERKKGKKNALAGVAAAPASGDCRSLHFNCICISILPSSFRCIMMKKIL